MNWVLFAVLLAVLAVLALACRQLRSQLRQTQQEAAHLNNRLAHLQQELVEVNKRRKKLLAASTQALIIVEADYTVSSANKVARRLFGKKPGKNASLMVWTRQHQLQELVESILRGEKMPPLYFTYQGRNLEAHARAIKQNKHTVAVALAIHDVTELQHLTRVRRDFVANISHELRTPVASIQLLADTLAGGALTDKKLAPKLVEKIAIQAEALSQMARELMDLSLIESGQAPLKLGHYSLRKIIQAQVDRLLPQAERKRLSVTIDLPEDVMVLADKAATGRVLGNLLHNAIKFTDKGGITIAARRSDAGNGGNVDEPWVTVSVSDTGIGIPPYELGRIFERFYKIDVARSGKKSGTGLGLAIARHVVEAHGGRIWAESDGLSGATFYFTLPVEEPAAHAVEPAG